MEGIVGVSGGEEGAWQRNILRLLSSGFYSQELEADVTLLGG